MADICCKPLLPSAGTEAYACGAGGSGVRLLLVHALPGDVPALPQAQPPGANPHSSGFESNVVVKLGHKTVSGREKDQGGGVYMEGRSL